MPLGSEGDALPPALCDGPAPVVDGLTLPAEDEPELGVGVGVGVEPGDGGALDWPGELGDALAEGGALVADEVGAGVEPYPPCNVTTVPPGEKVTVLVHGPEGAPLVAVATTAWDRPAASVPEL